MKWLIYVGVALLAAAAGFGIYRYGIQPGVEQTQTVTAEEIQQALDSAEPTSAQDDVQANVQSSLPETLPEFSLADLSGKPTSIRSWPGKAMIVNFWATWCGPCRKEIPLLRQIQREHGAEGFQVVGVAIDFREDVEKYAAEIGIDYPVLIGEQDGLEAAAKFGQSSPGLPFTVFTDKQHRIVLSHLGEIDEAEARVLLEVVGRVNSGELTPQAARLVAAKQLEALEPGEA